MKVFTYRVRLALPVCAKTIAPATEHKRVQRKTETGPLPINWNFHMAVCPVRSFTQRRVIADYAAWLVRMEYGQCLTCLLYRTSQYRPLDLNRRNSNGKSGANSAGVANCRLAAHYRSTSGTAEEFLGRRLLTKVWRKPRFPPLACGKNLMFSATTARPCFTRSFVRWSTAAPAVANAGVPHTLLNNCGPALR